MYFRTSYLEIRDVSSLEKKVFILLYLLHYIIYIYIYIFLLYSRCASLRISVKTALCRLSVRQIQYQINEFVQLYHNRITSITKASYQRRKLPSVSMRDRACIRLLGLIVTELSTDPGDKSPALNDESPRQGAQSDADCAKQQAAPRMQCK